MWGGGGGRKREVSDLMVVVGLVGLLLLLRGKGSKFAHGL